eukprot:jgi/Chrzof1/3668/Cz13g04120.t1
MPRIKLKDNDSGKNEGAQQRFITEYFAAQQVVVTCILQVRSTSNAAAASVPENGNAHTDSGTPGSTEGTSADGHTPEPAAIRKRKKNSPPATRRQVQKRTRTDDRQADNESENETPSVQVGGIPRVSKERKCTSPQAACLCEARGQNGRWNKVLFMPILGLGPLWARHT